MQTHIITQSTGTMIGVFIVYWAQFPHASYLRLNGNRTRLIVDSVFS